MDKTKKTSPVLLVLIHSTYPRLHSEIIDIADLLAGQLLQQTNYHMLYSPYQEAKIALYLPSMVWFPFPHTTVCSMLSSVTVQLKKTTQPNQKYQGIKFALLI